MKKKKQKREEKEIDVQMFKTLLAAAAAARLEASTASHEVRYLVSGVVLPFEISASSQAHFCARGGNDIKLD